jgi:AcrR family transcriptional regulator
MTTTPTGMGRRSHEHKRAMRDRILEAARQRFARSGFRGTNVPEIAREAGISVGLIYRYFPSKEELFLELCLEGSTVAYEALREQLATIDDPLLRLRTSFATFIEAHEGTQGLLVLQAVPAAAASDPRIGEVLARRQQELVAFSAGFVADLIARGEIDARTPVERTGRAVATLLDGAVVTLAIPGADSGALLDSMVGLVAASVGLGTTGSAPRSARSSGGGPPRRGLG